MTVRERFLVSPQLHLTEMQAEILIYLASICGEMSHIFKPCLILILIGLVLDLGFLNALSWSKKSRFENLRHLPSNTQAKPKIVIDFDPTLLRMIFLNNRRSRIRYCLFTSFVVFPDKIYILVMLICECNRVFNLPSCGLSTLRFDFVC